MRARLAIGDFATMTHLSIKALRHYHELGLLEPAEVDPATGYRFYQPGQVRTAQIIRRLRDLGMPLDEIRAVLGATDVPARNEVMATHLRRMESRLSTTQSIVDSLRSLLDQPSVPVTVEYRSVSAVRALAISGTVSAPELDDWWDAAFRELDGRLAADGARPAGPRCALYSPEYFALDTGGEVTAYVPVDPDVAAGGRARMVEVPPAELAIAVHFGSFAELDRTYGALGTHVAEREIGIDGPIREHYLVTAFDTEDESRYRTEVGWPIFRTRP